jgi:hypothetical protein
MITSPLIGRRGVEVTGHQQCYDSALAWQPYCRWSVHLRLPVGAG